MKKLLIALLLAGCSHAGTPGTKLERYIDLDQIVVPQNTTLHFFKTPKESRKYCNGLAKAFNMENWFCRDPRGWNIRHQLTVDGKLKKFCVAGVVLRYSTWTEVETVIAHELVDECLKEIKHKNPLR